MSFYRSRSLILTRIATVLVAGAFLCCLPRLIWAQTNPILFPDAVRGARDITQAPYYADPTGQRNSLPAFIYAAQKNVRADGGFARIVYIPPGNYRLSPTLQPADFVVAGVGTLDSIGFLKPGDQVAGDLIPHRNEEGKSGSSLVWQGAGKDHTTVTLEPGSLPDPATERKLFRFQGANGENNRAFYNMLKNITVVTTGNPGCVPVKMGVANRGGFDGVRLIGDGKVGLDLEGDTGPAAFLNSEIRGFNVGVRAVGWENGMSFDNVQILDYTEAGILTTKAVLTLTAVTVQTQGVGPAVRITTDEGGIYTDQCVFEGSGPVGIDNTAGGSFTGRRSRFRGWSQKAVDNFDAPGYLPDVLMSSSASVAGAIYQGNGNSLWLTHYASRGQFSLNGQDLDTTTFLPYRRATDWWEVDTAIWANINEYRAQHGDRGAWQQAIDDGAAHPTGMITSTRAIYRVDGPIFIGGDHGRNVKKLFGAETSIRGKDGFKGPFVIVGPTNYDTLYIDHLTVDSFDGLDYMFELLPGSPVVVVRHAKQSTIAREGSGDLFFYDAIGLRLGDKYYGGQNVWAWNMNKEGSDDRATFGRTYVSGANFYAAGFHTEKLSILSVVDRGGFIDYIGFQSEPRDPGYDEEGPAFLFRDGSGLIAGQNGQVSYDPNYQRVIVHAPPTNPADTLYPDYFPEKPKGWVIPQYVYYYEDASSPAANLLAGYYFENGTPAVSHTGGGTWGAITNQRLEPFGIINVGAPSDPVLSLRTVAKSSESALYEGRYAGIAFSNITHIDSLVFYAARGGSSNDRELIIRLADNQGGTTTILPATKPTMVKPTLLKYAAAVDQAITDGELRIYPVVEGGSGRSIILDSIKVYGIATPSTATEIVIDNTEPGFSTTGDWKSSTTTAPFYQTNYVHDKNTGKGSKTATFQANVSPGFYQVYGWWSADYNRATNVPFEVTHAQGKSTVIKDQSAQGGDWVSLGDYEFGTTAQVTIRTAGTDNYVIADAVKFVSCGPAPCSQARQQTSNHVKESGIEEAEALAGELSVYPNPTDQRLEIRLPSKHCGNVSLVDLTGRVIYQKSAEAESSQQTLVVPTAELREGMYLLRWQQADRQQVVTVLISH